MKSYFYFVIAGFILLQIYLSLRKRWYIGMVLPIITLIAPFVISAVPVEFVHYPDKVLLTLSVLTALIMLGILVYCRIFIYKANKDVEEFVVTEVTEDLQKDG